MGLLSLPIRCKSYFRAVIALPVALTTAIALFPPFPAAQAQVVEGGRALTVRSDIQEANSETGVITARGNVQINYPARQIQATSAQAQYFSRERRLVLSGNVYVLQEGNSIRAETVTYLVDEGRFVAIPKDARQVESIYIVSDPASPAEPTAPQPKLPANSQPSLKK
jgi:lipopolysaccharide export system protein LptA